MVDTVEWACILCGHPIQMAEWVGQQIWIRFWVKHFSTETIWILQKATAMGNWWLAASLWQSTCSCITSWAEVFWQNVKSLRWLSTPAAQVWCPVLLAFPKTQITCGREEIPDHWWDSGKYNRAADGEWENCVRSQGAYFEEDWDVIVPYTILLVSSSINVFIFHIIRLDTFWTDLVYLKTGKTFILNFKKARLYM